MNRSALKRHTPLRRKTRLRPINRVRRKRLYERNFGSHADFVRVQPCVVPTCARLHPKRLIHPHHVKARGMGGAGGSKEHLVPLCWVHHDFIHTQGQARFQSVFSIDLGAAAARLWAANRPERGTA